MNNQFIEVTHGSGEKRIINKNVIISMEKGSSSTLALKYISGTQVIRLEIHEEYNTFKKSLGTD